jgi:tetratricopeptide (TPR) repeat protein
MRISSVSLVALGFVLTLAASAPAAIEVGDRVAITTETSIQGEGGATQKLVPGAVVLVEQVDANRLWVSAIVAGWIDAAAVMELDAAVTHFAELAAKSPKDPAPLRALGNVLRAHGRLEAALDNFCRAEALAPDDPLTHRWRASLIVAAHYPDEATGDICAAVRLTPNDAAALLDRGAIYCQLDRDADALADYEAALKLAPQSPLAHIGRGDIRAARGDVDGAIADYTEAMRLDPQDARAMIGRANCHARQQKEDLALADLQAAIKANPKSARAYLRLARLELDAVSDKIRDPAKAIEHARKAAELSQWRWMEPAMTLAEAQAAAGDASRAVEMRIAALRIGMAETSHIANWRLRSHFEHCRHCRRPDIEPASPSAPVEATQ